MISGRLLLFFCPLGAKRHDFRAFVSSRNILKRQAL